MKKFTPLFNDIKGLIDEFIHHIKRPEIIGPADDLAWNNHLFSFSALLCELLGCLHQKPMHIFMDEAEKYLSKELGLVKKIPPSKFKKMHRLQVELEAKRERQEKEEKEMREILEREQNSQMSLNSLNKSDNKESEYKR